MFWREEGCRMIEESTIKHIIECWATNQAHQGRGRAQRPLPNLPDVKEVIETSFFASIKREENRLSYFSVVLASSEDLSEQPHRYRYELQHFRTPLPFTVESICKLAPAFDPNRSAIAVGRTNGNNELTCWGIFFFEPRSHLYNEIPVGTEGGTCFRPDLFHRDRYSSRCSKNISHARTYWSIFERRICARFSDAIRTSSSRPSSVTFLGANRTLAKIPNYFLVLLPSCVGCLAFRSCFEEDMAQRLYSCRIPTPEAVKN